MNKKIRVIEIGRIQTMQKFTGLQAVTVTRRVISF